MQYAGEVIQAGGQYNNPFKKNGRHDQNRAPLLM